MNFTALTSFDDVLAYSRTLNLSDLESYSLYKVNRDFMKAMKTIYKVIEDHKIEWQDMDELVKHNPRAYVMAENFINMKRFIDYLALHDNVNMNVFKYTVHAIKNNEFYLNVVY